MNETLVAVILAGGVGTRFWPLTTHKMLFPFLGKTFFEHAVTRVLPKEVSKVVVVVNEDNRESIQSMKLPVKSVTVVQRNARGMADAILCAESEIKNASLLIHIADHLVDESLFASVVKEAATNRAFGILPGSKVSQYQPMGYLELEGKYIKGIHEKPGEGNEPSEFVNITGHYIADSNTLLTYLKATTSDGDDVYEKALSALMRHQDVLFLPYSGTSVALKYSWDVLSCMDELLGRVESRQGKNVVIKNNVTIEGNVYIEDNVKIFENTKITGPCFIGEGSIIGNNNIIRASHIGRNCVTGFNTDITRSYVGDDCWFHSNYIGDSVLEGGVSLGSGAVLANLRLDEGHIESAVKGQKVATYRNKLGSVIGRDVRIGVNASIMPGVKIGRGCFVGSGVVLDRDLPDDCFCTQKSDLAISKNLRKPATSREAFKSRI